MKTLMTLQELQKQVLDLPIVLKQGNLSRLSGIAESTGISADESR